MPTRSQGDRGRPARSAARMGDDGRRLGTAGHGLVVGALALVLGVFLTAPGMHKSAFNRQPGTVRDVALAVTGPLARVSHALLLDRPRHLVQVVIGRGSADEIDTAIALPPQAAPAEPGRGRSRVPRSGAAFTPSHRLRLWVAGDSLVIVPGYSIVRAAGAAPAIQSVGGVEGRIATGLTRPDAFNWFTRIATQMKKLRPSVVVLDFGANDDHDYMTGLPAGTSVGSFGSPTWQAEYRRRVAGVMDTVNRAGAVVVWIGLPVTRSETQTRHFDTINAIVQKEARSRPGRAIFVDTYTMFAGDSGTFVEYLENATGDTIKVRAGDGVHFDTAGGDLIARQVLKELNRRFDLTSWRRSKSS